MDTNISSQTKTLAGQWVHVFRTGTHTDSKGRKQNFTQADLDQIVANHALGQPPAVIGHPKNNDPAWAWASDIKRDGDDLFVKFHKVHPAFDQGVQSGSYQNRSVSIYKDGENGLRLRHIGFLGAVPPAIDGLQPISFSDGVANEDVMEFASPARQTAWGLYAIRDLFRGLRDWIIAQAGVEEADRILPNYELDNLASSADSLRDAAAAEENNQTTTGDPMPQPVSFSKEQLDAAVKAAEEKARAEAKQEAEAEFSKQVEDATSQATAIKKERQAERINAQIEGWKKAGKVLPADAPGMAEFMASLDDAPDAFEFSAADGEKKTQAASEWFADFMAKQPKRVDLGKRSSPDDEPKPQTPVAIAAKAMEFQKAQADKGIEISMTEAVAHITGS